MGGHVATDERTRRIWSSQAIVPHVTEFQDCKDGLIIEFYDIVKKLVHTYKDARNKLGVRIKIFDTPKEVAIWTRARV